MPKPTHKCPGGCGERVSNDLLACSFDWFRLPQAERNAVWKHSRGSREHREAVAAAVAWYRANPRT
jgi:hypothetical protein